jgi:hypothetical protein
VRPAFCAAGRVRVGEEHVAASAGETLPAAQGMGGSTAVGGASSGAPAAASEGVWAGGADELASTEDSEGSWATVDDSEQEQLQQQQQQQEYVPEGVRKQHDSRTCRRRSAAFECGVSDNSSNISGSRGIGMDSSISFSHDSPTAAGHSSSPTSPMTSCRARQFGLHGLAVQQQQQQQQYCHPQPHARHSASTGQHTAQKAWHDPEQPVSPVSCESSLLAGRIPAEVVFSPHKNPAGASNSADAAPAVSPLRPCIV